MTSKEELHQSYKESIVGLFWDNEGDVDQIISDNPDSRYQILAENVTYEKAQKFRQLRKIQKTIQM